jgi:carbon-monoxide dehydrogenase medium subunit
VFPNQFDYHRPESVQAAASLLAADPDAKLLAGGHSLLPAMKLRLASPSSLVDLGAIDGLVGIDASGKITIGAMTTYAMLRDSRELSRVLPMVTEAADNVGDPAVQARGTLGGALAHSDPAADFTAIFLALNGSVDVTGAQGSRTIGADELFVDLFTTALQPDEIITSVSFQAPAPGTGMAYEKFRHPASGYAVVGVAAVVGTGYEQGDTCRQCRTGRCRTASRRRVDRGRGGGGWKWTGDQRRPFRIGGLPKTPCWRADGSRSDAGRRVHVTPLIRNATRFAGTRPHAKGEGRTAGDGAESPCPSAQGRVPGAGCPLGMAPWRLG